MSEAKKAVKEENVSTEKAYDLAVLRKDSVRLLGVTASTFDGALGNRTGKITMSEAKRIIESWKKEAAK